MKRVMIALLALSAVCSRGQTVEGPVSILDHRFLAPSSQIVHEGQLFVSYYDRPGVRVFDPQLTSSKEVEELNGTLAGDLFHIGDNLLIKATDGSLYGMDISSKKWLPLGMFDCVSHQYDRDLFVLNGDEVSALELSDGTWQQRFVGKVKLSSRPVVAFVVIGDTIVYAYANSPDIVIATTDGKLVRSVASHSPVEKLQLFGDGLIAISAIQRTSQVLRSNSLSKGSIEYLYHNGLLVSLTNATPFVSNSDSGLIGAFLVYGSDPREGIYVARSLEHIERRLDLDSILPNTIRATVHGDRFLLSEYGRFALVNSNNDVTHVGWFGDSVFTTSAGVSFTQSGSPYLCGQAKFSDNTYPAILPANENDSVRVLEIEQARRQTLVRHVQLVNGPEVAFCSYGIYTRQGNTEWTLAFTSMADILSRQIDIVNDSIIVCRPTARKIVISTNKGLTWREILIDGYLFQMTPVLVSGETMFLYEPGTLWKVDLRELADSISPPKFSVPVGYQQRLFSCTREVVSMVTARSETDPAFNPTHYSHLVCHRWNSTTMQVDSVRHELAAPMRSEDLNFFVRRDTAYIWCSLQRRLLAVTYEGIVYDTTFAQSAFGVLRNEYLSKVATDNQGNPWLFSTGQVTGFKLDPSRSIVSSVHEYYEHLYVSSVRPNPATDDVDVTIGRFPAADDESMKLYLVDIQGRKVRDYTQLLTRFPAPNSTQDVRINVDDLPMGMYLVVIENSQGKSTRKLMVNP